MTGRTVTVDLDHLRDLIRAAHESRRAVWACCREPTDGNLEQAFEATTDGLREAERLEMAHPEIRS